MGALAGGARAKKAVEPDVAHEPVTTTRLPQVALSEPTPAPTAEVDLDDHGTAPLSSDDLDALEAELAATVEGTGSVDSPAQTDDADLTTMLPAPDRDDNLVPDERVTAEADDQL